MKIAAYLDNGQPGVGIVASDLLSILPLELPESLRALGALPIVELLSAGRAMPATLAPHRAGCGAAGRADPPAAPQHLLRRQELPRARQGVRRQRLRQQRQGRRRHPQRADLFQQGARVRDRAGRATS